MVRVRDLDASVEFYTALFGAAPGKLRRGYARWLLDDPRLHFSIAQAPDRFGVEHLGLEAETADELTRLRERIARAGGRRFDEGETTCCYAQSDKTWVEDDQGVSWEAFYTHGEADSFHGRSPGEDACCTPGTAQAEPCCPDLACC